MVGSRFCELYRGPLIEADFSGKISVDITDFQSVNHFFARYSFEWLILFSAFTDVDAAEKQRDNKKGACWQINVEGVKNIVNACKSYTRKLIFISTDFVFDGSRGPYAEEDITGPDLTKVSWYGISKIQAEKSIQKSLNSSIILRIAYPYRAKFEGKDDIAKRILRLYKNGKLYPMFDDQQITPTFIDDLEPAIDLLVSKNQKGIFHLASPALTTQYRFAKQLIKTFGTRSEGIKKGSVSDFLKKPDATPRPIRGGLKVGKIVAKGFEPTSWEKGIKIIWQLSKGQLI